jgi:hypothetical protein
MRRMFTCIGCLLFSCATFAGTKTIVPSNPLPDAGRNDCFTIRFSKDRRVLDDKRLLVWENGELPYLVELDRLLKYLSSSGTSITLVDGDGDGFICSTFRDSIVRPDALLSKSRKIVGVTRLSGEDLRVLEAHYNKSLARKKRGQWGGQGADGAEPQSEDAQPESRVSSETPASS